MDYLTKAEIVDILYTGNCKGPYKTSKVGEKYDNRRGRIYRIFLANAGWLDFLEVTEDNEYTGFGITTTLFVKKYELDGFLYLETVNSIYKCKPMN